MFDALRSFFKKTAVPQPEAAESAPAQVPPVGGSGEDALAWSRWLPADDEGNPFGMAGCDCFKFPQSMRSTTSKEIAATYILLRSDIGAHLVDEDFPDPVDIACKLEYDYTGEVAEGAIFKAKEMEEKWDIYLYGSKIYMCRSWTGNLAYIVTFEFSNGKVKISNIRASREMIGGDEHYTVREVNYLFKSHVFKMVEPHPLPAGLSHDLRAITAFSFKTYGSKCCFATFEDTRDFKRPPRKTAHDAPAR